MSSNVGSEIILPKQEKLDVVFVVNNQGSYRGDSLIFNLIENKTVEGGVFNDFATYFTYDGSPDGVGGTSLYVSSSATTDAGSRNNTYLSLAPSKTYNAGVPWTVAFYYWIMQMPDPHPVPLRFATNSTLVTLVGDGSIHPFLGVSGSGDWRYRANTGATVLTTGQYKTDMVDKWHSYIWTCDGSDIIFYYDGVADGNLTPANTQLRILRIIGGYSSSSVIYATPGYFKSFYAWNVQLTATEVEAVHDVMIQQGH